MRENRKWLILSLVLVLTLVAGPSWASDSQAGPKCGSASVDPICEVWTREDIERLPWPGYTQTAWPLMVLPAWRYDTLTERALKLDDCTIRLQEEQQLCDTWREDLEQRFRVERLRLQNALEACEDTLDQDSGKWAWWQVTLLGVGVGIVGVGAGVLVGWLAM